MNESSGSHIISHWHKLVDNLEASPTAFYAEVERAIRERAIPGASTARVEWSEGGVLSAKRTYLRVTRGKLTFDICGAPFGRGFFFSTWLTDQAPSRALLGVLVVLMVMLAGLRAVQGDVRGAMEFLIVFLGVVIASWFLIRGLVGAVFGGSEEKVLSTPVFGRVYEVLFKPHTYYRIDTALMFQSAVLAAVHEVIDGTVKEKGLRELSESDRKPVHRSFLRE